MWDFLLNAFHLIHGHQEVVRNHALDGIRVVVKSEAFYSRVDEIPIKIVIDLIGGIELRAIDSLQPVEAFFQIIRPPIDRSLGVVGPAHVLARIAIGRRKLWILRHPIFPIFIKLSRQSAGSAVLGVRCLCCAADGQKADR